MHKQFDVVRCSMRRIVGIVGAVFATTLGCVEFIYYRNVWTPEQRRLHHQQQLRTPLRHTQHFVTGSGNCPSSTALSGIGQSLWYRLLLYGLVVMRMAFLIIHVMPVAWYAFLTYVPHLCEENVFFEKLCGALGAMGPSYTKLGQWMATRPDIFSPAMSSALERLYDRTEAHSWSHTERTLRNTVQKYSAASGEEQVVNAQHNILYYLREIEKIPINSGSIAQVHRGVLREDVDGIPAGTELAVKVLHPWTREIVFADLLVMQCVIFIVTTVLRDTVYLDLKRSLYEFSSLLCSQLDLQRECDNLRQFAFNFHDFPGVIFPAPLPSLCGPDVLIETFEEGCPLQKAQCGHDHRDVAELGCHMFLKMLFEDNFVHADLHPGNVLLRTNPGAPSARLLGMSTATTYPDGKPILKHELVILDAGLATSLSRVDRNNFFSLFAAVACGDGALGADLMIDRLPPERRALQSKADRDKLRADMTEIFNIVSPGKSGGFRLRDISLGGMLQKVMSALRSNSTPLDGNFASLVLTVIVAEGLGKKLTPDFNLFAESAPYLVELLEDSELCFLAEKLRSLYGAKALLWNSLDFVKLERTPTYVEVVLRKISRTTDRAIQWFATRSATSNVS